MPGSSPVVLFQTPYLWVDNGWQVAARRSARAMAMGGLDVRLASFGEGVRPLDPEIEPEVRAYLGRPAASPHLQVLSAALLDHLRMIPVLSYLGTKIGPRAFHAMFERQNIEPQLAASLKAVGGIWAQCSANEQTLRGVGIANATFIPVPYFDDDPLLRIDPPREVRRMLWVGRNEPRKEPKLLLRAFLLAFSPGEAELTMKISPPFSVPMPTLECALQQELRDPEIARHWSMGTAIQSIHFVHGKLTRQQMVEMHARHDCYVSASRGEGWELSAFDAKVAGRPVVAVDCGGPRDFMNDGDILISKTGTVPAHPGYSVPGALFADYRLQDLVFALQSIRGARVQGSRAHERCRAENVGRLFRQWAESVVADFKPLAPPPPRSTQPRSRFGRVSVIKSSR